MALIPSGCNFLFHVDEYHNTTRAFVDALAREDYEMCLNLFALDHPGFRNTNLDTLKAKLAFVRGKLVADFGDELDYKFIRAEKKLSSGDPKSAEYNTTTVWEQVQNGKEYGIIRLVFDDASRRILNIHLPEDKKPVPSMAIFWVIGLAALCIPLFNMYVIRLIALSDLRQKWLKYMAVFVFNVPTISYLATGSLTFRPLYFQFLLGFSFSIGGYAASAWSIGLPLGGLYWLLKLRNRASTSPTEDPSGVLDQI